MAPAQRVRNLSARATSGRLGLLAYHPVDEAMAVAAAARYYGLDLEVVSATAGPGRINESRLDAGYPMLGLSLEGLESLPEGWLGLVRNQLARGGTVHVNGVVSAEPLRSLLAGLGIDGGASDRSGAVSTVTFTADRPGFGAELGGLALETATEAPRLSIPSGGAILAHANWPSPAEAVTLEVPTGSGRLVVSAGTQRLRAGLAGAFEPHQVLSVLPAMMLMREVYGQCTWHAAMSMADLVIDDPMLCNNRLGIDYPSALAATEEGGFHLTVATVPRELSLAEPEVVALLAQHPERLSACYHGNDHAGYEFYRSSAGVRRFRSRALDTQLAAIRGAAERGHVFANRTGHSLDRVMVFPHGLSPAELLPSLGEAGFLATCNWLDRYPLEAPCPDDYDLGLRPADVGWGGFPLLWRRRPVDTAGLALDLFLGRPAIAFGHRKNLGTGFQWPRDLAARVNGLGVARPVVWRGLEEIARHAYLQRSDGTTWRALMTANEICLHNPDPEPRIYHICRPHAPTGAALVSESATAAAADELVVTVMPRARRIVRMVFPGASDLPRPGGRTAPCTLPP
ncbi:MAG TPA: hypothetical protein VGR61_05795 [Candidatus Dormibacteraeota bacterium]|nr:hypothetical protein [Candidatus Dormibacteraeota bacterium]